MADKKCGLYARVSTERQAQIQEGSIETQIDRMQQYIKYKAAAAGDNGSGDSWHVTDIYREEGKSGKDTDRPELQRLISDIKNSCINTVMCTKIDRITRSIIDFHGLHEIFTKHNADFISLEENFDTSTPIGKAALNVTLVFAELEREQTSKRTKDKMLWRAEQGLWNGGHILGYDLDPARKGYLVPNKQEAETVNFLLDTYLKEGSVLKIAKTANEKGYRPKRYVSTRTKKLHEPRKFSYSSVLKILTNRAYIAEKEINKNKKGKNQDNLSKEERYAISKAKWQPIVEKEKFERVQVILKDNLKHKNNGAAPTKHFYLFNGGLLTCEKCGSRMEGRNSHGRGNKTYYYYYCVNTECRYRVPEKELEYAFQVIVKGVAFTPSILRKTAERLNAKLLKQLPYLKERRRVLNSELAGLKNHASQIIDKFLPIENGKALVEEKLAEITNRQTQLDKEVRALNSEISNIEGKAIDEDTVKRLLGNLNVIFEKDTKPYQKRNLLTLILDYLRINDKEMTLGVNAGKFRSDITRVARYDSIPNATSGSQYSITPCSNLCCRGLLFKV